MTKKCSKRTDNIGPCRFKKLEETSFLNVAIPSGLIFLFICFQHTQLFIKTDNKTEKYTLSRI